MTDNPKKRKQAAATSAAPKPKRPRFPNKPPWDVRTASTSTAYPNGELNVSRFMRAHENEIRSLEKAMKAAKKGLSRRAFQDVPRDLRRRTGSHNPQRVPKRLRLQARKEAKDDNTPTSKNKSGSGVGKGNKKWLRKEGIEKSKSARDRRKTVKDVNKITVTADEQGNGDNVQVEKPLAKSSNAKDPKPRSKKQATLAKPASPPSRFRRRQVHKTWLPTHIWHAKRAFMTPPKEPLWRFAIPLAPVVKAYRLTHRAASLRGAVAWDMSYMATIGLEGVEASIVGLLKGLRFAEEDKEKLWQEKGTGKKWRDGTRVWEGWIHEREGNPPKRLARATVIWSVLEASWSKKREAFIRIHPSAFLQLWNEIIRIAKVQKPAVTVEDLRFEIGSIDITGPSAAQTLCSILSPSPIDNQPPDAPQSVWPQLASVTDVGVLPSNPVLAFNISDPRLHDPPRTVHLPQHPTFQDRLTETLAFWPLDKTQPRPAMFSRNARLAAGRSLPSQQSINRRKAAAIPGQYPEARSLDPQIPMLTYASQKNKSWTILLPWKCVLPVWRCILRYPLSTGGNPRFGGLKELRQVHFERSDPQFPFDCPGTDAGWSWELQERVERQKEWTKRPKGKRVEWTTIDLGNGRKGEVGDPWACHWELLLSKQDQDGQSSRKDSKAAASPFRQSLSKDASDLLTDRSIATDYSSLPSVFTVKITMVQRGVPTNCARIYRLPTNNPDLRSKWLSLMPGAKSTDTKRASTKRNNPDPNTKNLPDESRTRALAASLLEQTSQVDSHANAHHNDYPMVPDEGDLMGFVTTGNYNLAEGMPTAIGNLVLQRVLPSPTVGARQHGPGKERHLCIVREAGQNLGRLARWELV